LALPDALPDNQDHELKPGSPYMVMEYLEEGTLHSLHGKCEWEQARGLLIMLLEALSHAHARGVLHRDLKPANVLLRNQGTEAVLTDFGLVFPLSSEDDENYEDTLLGTPSAMAPEQVLKAWRDFGPWTDLYGLGCLTYLLLGNHSVYKAETLEDWLEAHCYQPPQALRNKVALPQGVFGWLEKLLAKNPYERFSTASDALVALLQAEKSVMRSPWKEESTAEVDFLEGDSSQTSSLRDVKESGNLFSPPRFFRPAPGPVKEHPWPDSSPQRSSWKPIVMQDVGVGLVGLRSLPLIARHEEREVLWASLKTVYETSQPLMVLMEGPAGCGKSHLARWLCEESQEAGVAQVLRATHDPLHGTLHGLRPMMNRFCQCRGLNKHQTYERLQHLFPDVCSEPALRALATWMQSSHDDESFFHDTNGFSSASERYLTLERVLLYLAHQRPLLLCFEDVQWGSDAVGFVDFLLRRKHRSSLPLMLLLTYRRHETRRAIRNRLKTIVERQKATLLSIGPLNAEEQEQLLQELLVLQPELHQKVLQRTEGNPLFAIQLVRDWVDRKMLVAGDDGYRLSSALEEWLPDDLHVMWLSRLHRAVKHFSGKAMEMLELAAALGQEVDGEEWKKACAEAGMTPPMEVLQRLAEQQLIFSEHDRLSRGWSFVHGMLRESLERQARENERWANHHRCCALMLQKGAQKKAQEREGRHWMEAGEKRLAFPLLLTAAERHYRRGEYPQAEDLLELCFQAIQSEPASFAQVQCRAWIVRGNLRFVQGERQESCELGQKAAEVARQRGWKELLGHALHLEGRSLSSSGQESLEQLLEAEVLFQELGKLEELGLVHTTLGYNARFRGDFKLSIQYAQQALEDFASAGQQNRTAEAHKLMGTTYLEQRLLDKAQAHFETAMEMYQARAHRLGVASCTNALGEIARKQQRWREAESMYLRSVELQEAIGAGHIAYPQVNLAQVWLQLGRYKKAETLLLEVLEETKRQGLSRLGIVVYGGLLACVASLRKWPEWSQWFRELKTGLNVTGFVESDLAELLALAGQWAQDQQQLLKARQAYKLSLLQWEGLGQTTPQKRLKKRLESLEKALGFDG
jgi:tetratricopeptide (TPR) repeat protein